MMNKIILMLILIAPAIHSHPQVSYDSITISRSTIENDWHGSKWTDSLKLGTFKNYTKDEKTVWVKTLKTTQVLPQVISLINQIRANGTADVTKCFIPRHSINFYKSGKITRYMLVCFECDGIRFSDEPVKPVVKNVEVREKQMQELKEIFKELL